MSSVFFCQTELQEKNALLISERMKLEQLVASLRTNVSHERQLRTRLDESRQALKQQLQDMELAVEHEKEQVCFLCLFTCSW